MPNDAATLFMAVALIFGTGGCDAVRGRRLVVSIIEAILYRA
jgi:hypothetical protein